MTTQDSGTFDYRLRNLAVLGAAAIISAALAAFALIHQKSQLAPKYPVGPFFPGLAAGLENAAHIRIESKKGMWNIMRQPDGQWVVAERSNYPASLDQVHKVLVGLATLETIEPKTARPDWFHYVNLDAPPKGNGIRIDVSGGSGGSMAGAVFGATEDIGDPSGALGIFVRRPAELQSWLVRSVFDPKSDPGDWMDKSTIKLDRERIQEADVTPTAGPPYSARREKPSDADFKLSPLPSGREPSNEAAADGVASAMTGFTFDDVRPVGQVDFSRAARVTTKTFDGLAISASVVQLGQDYWAKLAASADSSHPAAEKEAAKISAQSSPWAYKLPPYEGQLFTSTLESLLKPAGAPAKTEE